MSADRHECSIEGCKHTCPIIGCSNTREPEFLMCRRCWRRVSDLTRGRVNRAWRTFLSTSRSYRLDKDRALLTNFANARKSYEAARDDAIAEASRFVR